jgi:hypothetical protein
MARRRFDLEPGEAIVEEWVSAIPNRSGKTAKYGGTLVLTTHRLIWEAIRLPPGLDQFSGSMLGEDLLQGVPLDRVTRVRADEERHALIHITTTDGERTLLIGASKWTPAWSQKHRVARDGAVARLQAAIR